MHIRTDGLRSITVEGVATESVMPDVAEITVGTDTNGASAGEALAANNKAMSSLLNILKQRGIAPRDLKTSGLYLTTVYEKPESERSQDRHPPKILHYKISNSIVITFRDVSKVGELLDLIVKSGANEIGRLSFRVSDPKAILRKLRKLALADARAKAEELAADAGMTLGYPISIDVEDSSSSGDGESRSNMVADVSASRVVPIAVGEEQLKVSVVVGYELKLGKQVP
jgi:uncharacterized protein YggE